MTDETKPAEVVRQVPSGAMIPLDQAPFTFKTLQAIANTEFVPAGLRGKPNAILAAVLMGRELGLGPMESMRSISVIDGRPSPSAEWMVARIFEAGHVLTVPEQTAESCTVKGERYRDGELVTEQSFTFTIEMAKRAGLASKNNWKHYPEAMLYWRAVAQLARQLFPDVLAGIKHTPEELRPNVSAEVWEVYGAVPEEEDVEPSEGSITDDDGELIEDAEVVEDEDEDVAEPAFAWRPKPSGEEDSVAIARVRQYVDPADLWADLYNTLETYEAWITEAMPTTRAEVRFICRAMEALGVWQSNDTLHEELRRINHKHLSELRRDELDKMAKTLVTKATVATRNA
jgi:hypothetical protein